MVKKPILKYSTERLLYCANPKGEYFFKKTTLNKVLYLLYLRLKERNVDIQLPYFWYKFGTLADEKSYYDAIDLPFSRYFKQDGFTRAMSYVPRSGVDELTKSIIDEEIIKLLKKYQDNDGYFVHDYLQLILDDVYATAPYEFQRTFNRGLYKYVNQFKTIKRKKIPSKLRLGTDDVQQISQYLSKLLSEFPDDFTELFDLFLEWEDTMELALKYNHTTSLKLLDDFWDIFARSLRIKKNENIPKYVIDEWIERYEKQDLKNFEKGLNINRNELLSISFDHRQSNTDVDKMVDEIMDCAYKMSFTKQSQ
ncbi:MAG: hypothetical protein NTV10_00080 [Methanoregula sp.]|nr:hypothetical protein [Methanoregula sp.]